MTKAEIRRHYKARRAALPAARIAALSQQLADQFFTDTRLQTYLTVPGAVLHTYLPIHRQHEADTWPIIRRLWAGWPHVPVLSSVADAQTHTLTPFELTPGTLLAENRWGIPEPQPPIRPTPYVPTLVLVPLLAFDEYGHRVGYGGGYYDRFLAQLPASTLTVGLSLFGPLPHRLAAEPTDIPLQACLEPSRPTRWFQWRRD